MAKSGRAGGARRDSKAGAKKPKKAGKKAAAAATPVRKKAARAPKPARKKAVRATESARKTSVRGAKPARKKAAAATPSRKTSARAAKPRGKAQKKRPSAPRTKAPPKRGAFVEGAADAALVDESLDVLHAHGDDLGCSLPQVGEHLIERYFDGDEDLARDRTPAKPRSYELLVARAESETAWDAADLRRSVIAALAARTLPEDLARAVPASHLVRLDTVADPAVRTSLAQQIASGELRGHTAAEAIAQASGAKGRAARAPAPGPVRLANALERLLDRADDFGGLDAMSVRHLEELERAAIAGRIDDVARRLTALAAKIRVAH